MLNEILNATMICLQIVTIYLIYKQKNENVCNITIINEESNQEKQKPIHLVTPIVTPIVSESENANLSERNREIRDEIITNQERRMSFRDQLSQIYSRNNDNEENENGTEESEPESEINGGLTLMGIRNNYIRESEYEEDW